MKKLFAFILSAVALLITASCAEEINGPGSSDNGKEKIITVIATDKPAPDDDTKTYIDGTSVKWSSTDEYLKVFEVATPSVGEVVTTTQRDSFEGASIEEGAKMSFTVSMPDKSGEDYVSFDYYAVYPNSAVNGGSSVTGIALNTSASQTPSATNFDAKQDLLIAKKINNGASQASSPLNMQFARVVAIGKMTIKNLESEAPITKITFSAKVGDEPVALAGRTNFNLETANPVTSYASNTQAYSIILDYEGQSITANTSEGMVAYFTCYPFEINSTTPGSFKVVVETETQIFTKEVSVSSAKGLAFNIGKASVFSVNMDNIEGEYKTVDLCYANLSFSDVSNQLGGSYGNASVVKAHGDRWSMNATNASSSIGLKSNEASSYIKLPDFEDEISSVTITLAEVNASNSLTIDSTQGARAGDIATVAFVAERLEYTEDLSEAHVHTAFVHASGGQAKIVKVEVVAGTDTRTAFSAPSSVSASVNAENGTAIDVSWTAVENASGYLVSLEPTSGTTVVSTVMASPVTVPNLQENMEYTVSVQALPADYYLNTISDKTTYGETVATTTGVIDYSTIETSNVSLTAGTNGSSARVNGQDAIKVGTSSAGGSMKVTVPSGTEKLHLHAAAWNGVAGLSLNITGATVTPSSIALTADSGIANSSPFTLNGNPEDYYFELTLSGINAETDITFTSSTSKRFVVWGVNVIDDREDASLAWKKGGVAADSDTATMLTGDDTMPTIALDNSAHSHAVTYSSSNTGVATIVESGVGAGTITLVAAGQTTISAIFAGDEDYKPLTVSYTLTVSDNRTQVATPTFSHAAGEVEANQVVTISCGTAGATIYYTTDDSTPTTSSTQGTSVTIDAAKTIKAIAVKDDYQDSAVAEAAYTIPGGGNVTDVLDLLFTGVSGTNYVDWSGKTSTSDAVYAGNSAGGNDAIQLRSNNNNSGVVTTTSGGTAARVSVSWNSNTTDGRTLNVYGHTVAYSAASDLYGDDSGTLLGTIVKGTSTQLIISGNYSYIGLRSASGAMYLDEIDIEWGELGPTISMNTSSITGIAAAGLPSATASSAYNLLNNASNNDVTITCDGTVVTSATKNASAGNIDYTVAANTGAARNGWIKVKYGTEDAHQIDVSQLAATYILTLSATNGTVTASVGGTPKSNGDPIDCGATVNINATPTSGYAFSAWDVFQTGSEPKVVVSTAAATSPTTFTMPAYNVTASASFVESGGGGDPEPTEKEYYILNTATTAIATANSYDSYPNKSCATGLASPGTYPSTATWSVTCGSKQTSGLWLGSNNNQKAKMILSTGSITGASAIAAAIGVTTNATYYAAMICHTAFANITKVVLERDSTAGTAPSDVYLLRSTDGGTTYTLVERKADAASMTFTIASPAASAIYAIAIHSTGYCQYKVPVVTFYTTDNN